MRDILHAILAVGALFAAVTMVPAALDIFGAYSPSMARVIAALIGLVAPLGGFVWCAWALVANQRLFLLAGAVASGLASAVLLFPYTWFPVYRMLGGTWLPGS